MPLRLDPPKAGDSLLATKPARWNLLRPTRKSKAFSRCWRLGARRRPSTRIAATSPRWQPGSTGPWAGSRRSNSSSTSPSCAPRGLSPSTIARRVAAIRSFFRHQALLGARTDNPAAELDLPRRRRTLPRTLSPAEAERLVEAANGTTPRALRDRALVELLYGAGLRVSEAVGLQKSSVDLDARIVRCIGKGSKERIVPIGRAGRAGTPALPGPRTPVPGRAAPTRALPQREGRRAHARRRLPDPPQARSHSRARTWTRSSAPAAPLVRDTPARGRSRPTFGSGDARACGSCDDRAVHTCIRSAASRVVLPGASACAPQDEVAPTVLPARSSPSVPPAS